MHLRSIVTCLSLSLASLLCVSTLAEDVVLFPYFLGNGESGVYLCASTDGHKFAPLNDGQPVFTPPHWPGGQHLTRDPSICYHDGEFHMVWTSNWSGRVFGYAHSPDLKNWSRPQMVTPFAADLPDDEQPDNVWAPEIHFDPVQNNFQIVFASSIPREENDGDGSEDRHSNDHRLYSIRTSNFNTFTAPEVLFDHNYSVIDGQLAFDDRGTDSKDDDRWVTTIKREQNAPEGKNLRFTFNNPLQKDEWSEATAPVLGPGSQLRANEQVEGPTLLRFKDQWLLYADAFTAGHYTLITSPDLETWTDETAELSFPVDHPRHGTFFVMDRSQVGWPTSNSPKATD